jgi:hypothetical protein
MTEMAETRGESVSACIERTLEAGLRREAVAKEPALVSLRNAVEEADKKGAKLAAQILRDAFARESRARMVEGA